MRQIIIPVFLMLGACAVQPDIKQYSQAVETADLKMLEAQVEAGMYVDAIVNAQEETALHRAVVSGQDAVVERLLSLGADANLADSRGDTPLMKAVRSGRQGLQEMLFQQGSKPFQRNQRNLSAFDEARRLAVDAASAPPWLGRAEQQSAGSLERAFEAIRQRDSEEFRALLASQRFSLHGVDAQGRGLAFSAASNGCLNCLEQVLSLGLSINQTDAQGYSALHMVVVSNQTEVLQKLLAMGADPDVRDASGWTPLMSAALLGRVEASRILAGHSSDLSGVGDNGWSPLHFAINGLESVEEETQLRIIEILLQAGADPDVQDRHGATPLFLAAMDMRPRTVRALLDAGADPTLANDDGMTPLMAAAYNGAVGLVEQLAHNRDTVNQANGAGWTALHYSLSRPALRSRDVSRQVVAVLLKQGAQVNVLDENKDSPLHFAARNGHRGATGVILRQGGDRWAVNGSGRNFLQEAMDSGHDRLAAQYAVYAAEVTAAGLP